MTVPRAISEYFRCVNEEDWDTFRDLWTEDAVLLAVGARPREGREDVLAYYPKIFAVWSEHVDEPTRIIPAGDTVMVEIHFRGRTVDGTAAEFDAVDVFDLRVEKIARLSNWYDIVAARKAVGA
jgi:ketosteroid isomerase-like protein